MKKAIILIVSVVIIGVVGGVLILNSGKDNQNIVKNDAPQANVNTNSNNEKKQDSIIVNEVKKEDKDTTVKFEFIETEAMTPLVKIVNPHAIPYLSDKVKNINTDDYDFYTMSIGAVRLIKDQFAKYGKNELTNTEKDLSFVSRATTYLTNEENLKYGYKKEDSLNRELYTVWYAVKKGTNPEVKLVEGDIEIFNLSNFKFTRKVITSGTAHLWDTILVKDEFGTDHYLIPTSRSNYYNNWGQHGDKEGDTNSYFGFRFGHITDYKGVPNNLSLATSETYWNMQKTLNLKVDFGDYNYTSDNNKKINKTVYFDTTTGDDVERVRRDSTGFELDIRFISSSIDNVNFSNNAPIVVKMNNIDLIFDNIYWQ